MLVEAGAALLGAVQTGIGLVKGGKAKNDFEAAMKLRKPFETPDELYKLLQATQNNAQSGFDAETLDYLTSESDRAFTGSLTTTQRMGGTPNDASALFDQKLQGIMKIGAQNHALNLENFSKYLGALNTMADSKAAEWASQQDILKDRLQAANANRAAAAKNVEGGLNTIIGAASSYLSGQLGEEGTDRVGGVKLNPGEKATKVTGSGTGYTINPGGDLTKPASSIVRNGIRYNWNPSTQKYEPQS